MACAAGRLAAGCTISWRSKGRRWLQHFNGKRVLADMSSGDFANWSVEEFAEALELRSLRAVSGVWVRSRAVIFMDDPEANKAWCMDRQKLFLYLTSQ